MKKKGSPPGAAVQGARGRQEEKEARNELFAGQEEIQIDPNQMALEDQSVDQLVNTAVRTHKDTTASAQRALKAIEESKQIQAETFKNLEQQNKKMYQIGDHMDHLNEDLTYAERLLSYMRRCCCCWLCDSCTGADPEEARKRDWQRRVAKGKTVVAAGRGSPQPPGRDGNGAKAGSAAAGGGAKAGANGGGAAGGGTFGNPDIRLPDTHRGAEMGMHEETRKQNDMIDQIHAGLEHLLEGAKDMHDELGVQMKDLDNLGTKATATTGRIDDVNKNSQLRNMARGKPKTKKDDDMLSLPTKSSVVTAAAKRLAGV